MVKFIKVKPFGKEPKGNWYRFQRDPTHNYYSYHFVNKPDVTFEEVVNIFCHSLSKVNYFGAMSFIYFKYYAEFYEYLKDSISKDPKFKTSFKVKRFKKRYLNKWIAFIKYSDDTMYPQNDYFRKMDALLK